MSYQAQIFTIIIFGLALGSFGNVLLYRIPKGESIKGRSKCCICNKILGCLELIPVFSFLFQGGKCKKCKTKISCRYPAIEILTAIIFVATFITNQTLEIVPLIFLILSIYMLLMIALYDAATQKIPDVFTAALFIFALIFQITKIGIPNLNLAKDILYGMLVPIIFFGGMWTFSRGRWIGSGDIFLGGAIGALLGFQGTLISLFFAYTIGAVVALALIISGKAKRGAVIAFGPFLCVGAMIVIFIGSKL
ncbi:prepilin peptidase [Candidatus Peribacteria bacterium]|jgi:prepilin signal peptidase PulO-like enzyme (type II secretory pathway)|nr:prepilin peptidase [Candidatus Peribacteria bacterium]MBT4021707.1 prepilin peptidase [Candidatus Peribacteria bacterium]MBT4241170.1 prepilin peptidase [Candidatus Peribacteria bacterium]MBT4473923.1 prepilin peptidase [Candidatus Peribacteria bacterium]